MRSVSEHSAGVVAFCLNRDRIPLYLVIHSARVRNPRARWEFPKGGIEPHEEPREAAARELREETGIADCTFREGFERTVSYTYMRQGRKRLKSVTYFVGEVFDASTLRRSCEHNEDPFGCWYRWGSCAQVGSLLYHAKTCRLLVEADAWLRVGIAETDLPYAGLPHSFCKSCSHDAMR